MLFPPVASHDHYRTLHRRAAENSGGNQAFQLGCIYSLSRKLFNPVVYYIVTLRSRQRRQIKRRDTAVKRLTVDAASHRFHAFFPFSSTFITF